MNPAGPSPRGSDRSPLGEGTPVSPQRQGGIFVSLLRTLKAVAWSFVGLRNRSGLEGDGARLDPLHIVIVGFLAVLVFVASLILLVHWVVAP